MMIVLMESFVENLSGQPVMAVILAVVVIVTVISLIQIVKQWKLYGMVEYISKVWMIFTAVGVVAMGGAFFKLSQPYTPPPSNSLAIVIGNTANSPKAELGKDVIDRISDTLMMHRGEDPEEFIDSISIIEADGEPFVVDLDTSKMKSISENGTQAKKNVAVNVAEIKKQVSEVVPKTSGANYLEAIVTAYDEVAGMSDDETGSPNIIVIGSGLSDTGALNFATSGILTMSDEAKEDQILSDATEEYKDALKGANITFYGLGDVTAPQKKLTNPQRKALRDIYKKLVSGNMGARKPRIVTVSMTGESVENKYTVNPTDTECKNFDLTFDDSKLKFDGEATTFSNLGEANKSLGQVVQIYNDNKDAIKQITIEGYTAHYTSRHENLAGDRANAVRDYLIGKGLPSDKISAIGKGYGPFEYSNNESHDDTDSRNRMIKVIIERNAQECRR